MHLLHRSFCNGGSVREMEETMIYQGVKYEAVHNAGCDGCAFKGKEDCFHLPETCMKMFRDDRKGVIWVKVSK